MKKPLILLFFLTSLVSFGQYQMKINLTNGTTQSGIYKIKDQTLGWATKTKIVSKKTKEKYDLEDIKDLVLYTENDSILFEVIRVKKYLDSKKRELKLGQVGFKGNHIELFYVSEYVYQGFATAPVATISSYHEKYLRKKNDALGYNMGYLYGAGQRGVKKRIREFFKGCPELVEKVDSKKINKEDTLQIALFYEKNCGE